MIAINFTPLEKLTTDILPTKKKILLLLGVVTLLGPLFLLGILMQSDTVTAGFVAVLVLVVVCIIIIARREQKIIKQAFQNFAQANDFTYEEEPSKDLRLAHFFSFGAMQKFSFAIESKNATLPFAFFEFSYAIPRGSGKHVRYDWYPSTVLSLDVQKGTPQVYIHNIANNTLHEVFAEEQRIHLKIDKGYEDAHAVYAPHQYEIEALDLLDLSLITLIQTAAPDADIEFNSGKVFIYLPYSLYERYGHVESVKKLLSIYESLNEPLQKKMRTFSFSPIGDFPLALKKDGLHFLAKGSSSKILVLWLPIIISILLGIIIFTT